MSFKNKNIVREFPFFSHFMCLPLVEERMKQLIQRVQQQVEERLSNLGIKVEDALKRSSYMLGHLTLFMLTLRRQQIKQKLSNILKSHQQQIITRLNILQLQFTGIKYFTRINKNQKCNQLTVIYLEIDQKSQQILQQFVDYFTRVLLKNQIIFAEELKSMRIGYNHKLGIFQLETFHVTLFRCRGVMERGEVIEVFEKINQGLWENNGREEIGKIEHQSQSQQLQNQNQAQNNNTPKNKGNPHILTTIKATCPTLDVSTMMAFDQTQFYLPLIRLHITKTEVDKQ